MFTTLRYVKDTALVPEREGNVLSHLACKACRSRKLKCTGETNGCRRCLSKDITCSYPDPSQRTRRSRDNQKRDKSKQISQVPLPPHGTPAETSASYPPVSHDLTPALPSPWTEAPFQNWNDGSFLDGLLGNGPISQELNFLGEDMQVEGAGFFPLDHYECLNGFLGTGTNTSDSFGLTGISPILRPSLSDFGLPTPSNPLQQGNTPTPSSLLPAPPLQSSPTEQPCACLPTALHLLSLLTLSSTQTRLNIPRTIRLNKHILQQSKTLFSCKTCSTATAAQTMTILTVLCQKVISSYEHIIALLARQYYTLHNQSMEGVPSYLKVFDEEEDGDEEGGGEGQFQLRDYEVERFEEPCLFGGLVTLQLGILRAFLVRMKGVPEHFARDYVGLLDEVDKRVMKLGRFCSASCEV